MAIYNGRILMRKGNEADFDPSKLMSGEWAVSLDAGIVRICLEAGKVIRMATYEAFEEDMKQIEAILLECQSIEEAVRRINTEVTEKLNACAEYVQQAKGYSEQAKTSEANSKSYMQSAKTSEANAKVSETNAKASENSAKESENSAKLTEERAREVFESIPEDYSTISNDLYELAIKETASGEEIHVNVSSNLKLREFALYGKAKQNTTSGKNLVSDDWEQGLLSVDNGTSISSNSYWVHTNKYVEVDSTKRYTISGDTTSSATIYFYDENKSFLTTLQPLRYAGTPIKTITIPEKTKYVRFGYNYSGATETITPAQMGILHWLQLEEGSATEYEPYTGGIPSPNPQYPQPIEVSGENYNLLENTATSQTVNGVTFTVNEDKSFTVNGTASVDILLPISDNTKISANEEYILSGCPSGGSIETYALRVTDDITKANEDVGKGFKFSYSDVSKFKVLIKIKSGITVNNLTFYPMIRKASVKNNSYMPYGVDRVEVKSLGKNLIDFVPTSDRTRDGISFSKSDDGFGTKVVGTSTISYAQNERTNYKQFKLKAGKYKFVINVVGITNGNTVYAILYYDGQNMVTTATGNKKTFTLSKDTEVRCYAVVKENNATVDCVLYAMVCREEDSDEYKPYKETKAIINGEFAGIKVSSNGNYTDQNGQQWICDEVVKYADGSGAYVQRIGKVVFDGSEDENIKAEGTSSASSDSYRYTFNHDGIKGRSYKNALCSNLNYNYTWNGNVGNFYTINNMFACFLALQSVNDVKTFLASNPFVFVYELAELITTPLTAEEIAEIEKLHTFYPITNISNDFDCGMSVTYYCDSKNYINNQLAIMKQEQEEAMMNMLLLMPTEVQATMIENDTNDLLKESEI